MIQQIFVFNRNSETNDFNKMLSFGWHVIDKVVFGPEAVDYLNPVSKQQERAVFISTVLFVLEIDEARYADWAKFMAEKNEEEENA